VKPTRQPRPRPAGRRTPTTPACVRRGRRGRGSTRTGGRSTGLRLYWSSVGPSPPGGGVDVVDGRADSAPVEFEDGGHGAGELVDLVGVDGNGSRQAGAVVDLDLGAELPRPDGLHHVGPVLVDTASGHDVFAALQADDTARPGDAQQVVGIPVAGPPSAEQSAAGGVAGHAAAVCEAPAHDAHAAADTRQGALDLLELDEDGLVFGLGQVSQIPDGLVGVRLSGDGGGVAGAAVGRHVADAVPGGGGRTVVRHLHVDDTGRGVDGVGEVVEGAGEGVDLVLVEAHLGGLGDELLLELGGVGGELFGGRPGGGVGVDHVDHGGLEGFEGGPVVDGCLCVPVEGVHAVPGDLDVLLLVGDLLLGVGDVFRGFVDVDLNVAHPRVVPVLLGDGLEVPLVGQVVLLLGESVVQVPDLVAQILNGLLGVLDGLAH